MMLIAPRPLRAFSVTDIIIRKADNSTPETWFFDQARCQCNSDVKVEIKMDLTNKPAGEYLKVVAGISCLDASTKAIKAASICPVLIEETRISDLVVEPSLTRSTQLLMGTSCTGQQSEARSIFVYQSSNKSEWTEIKNLAFTVDTESPDAPPKVGVEAGENSVKVSFTPATTSNASSDSGVTTQQADLKGYQVLCEKLDANGQPAGVALAADVRPKAIFQTPATLCPGTTITDAGVVREAGPDTRVPDTRVPDTRVPDTRVPDTRVPDATPRDLALAEASAPRDAGVEAAVRDRGPVDSAPRKDSAVASTGCAQTLSSECVCSDISTGGTIQVRNLENGQKYRFHVVAIDSFYNASSVTTVGDAVPQPVEDLWKRYQRAGGRSSGGYCFVATAAYGSYDHPQVRILRDFRDQVLLQSSLGRIMVGSYYRGGAAPAAWLERHDGFKPLVRAALWPVTLVAAGIVYTSAAQKLLGLTLLPAVGMLLLRRRRERTGHGKRGRA